MQQRRSGLKNKRERAKERYDYENKREDAHVRDRLNGEFGRRNGARAVHVQIAPAQIDAQLVDERNEKNLASAATRVDDAARKQHERHAERDLHNNCATAWSVMLRSVRAA